MPTTRDDDGVTVFANRRDELAHQVKSQMEHYLQQNEAVHKELANLENKMAELIAVTQVLKSVIDGLSGALNTANSSDLPKSTDFNGKAGSVNVSGVVKDWHFGQR